MVSHRIWSAADLAEFLGLSVGWVYNHSGPSSSDPIPRCAGLRHLRFDSESKPFREWLLRNLGINVDINENS